MSKVTTMFYAVGSHCWGFAKTADEAIKLAKPNWYGKPARPKAEHFSVWKIERDGEEPIEITVSDIDGAFSYPTGATVTKIQTSTLAA